MFEPFKILLFSRYLEKRFHENSASEYITSNLSIIYVRLSLVSGNGMTMCLGTNTVSLPVYQSNCIGELYKIKLTICNYDLH